ncbi:MAG: HEAT repeat domain-containing protein [Planctomycetes bacterium]|nr:HEAT repeat domain-containing protein [Planctomycetota bacterium]
MKIFFCDVCNESIPVKLVQEGQISTVKGKVICPKCLPVAAPASEEAVGAVPAPLVVGKPPVRAAGSRAAGLLALLGCGLGAGALALGFSLRQESEEQRRELRESSKSITVLIQELADAEARTRLRVGEEERRFEAHETELEKARRALDAIDVLRRELDAETKLWEGRKLELEAGFAKTLGQGLEPLRTQAVRVEASVAKSSSEAQGLRNELARLAGRVDMLAGRAAESGPVAAPAPGGSGSAEAVALKDLPAAISKQVELLKDADASKVWAALTELGNMPDPRVIPYVIPTLSHSDPFVRHQAMTLLGDLNAKEAVEQLIQALGDEESWVREGAYTALRKITRQNLRFDTHASREQRAEAKAAWEKWWSANRDKVLGS